MATSARNAARIGWLCTRRAIYCLTHSARPVTGVDGNLCMVMARKRDGSFYVFGVVDLTDHANASTKP